MTREALGEFEHQVLLALLVLGGAGYSAPLVLELEERTRRSISAGAVFIALRRLEQRGYLRSIKEEAQPGEGGRGRRLFEITPQGLERVIESRRTFERFWEALDPFMDRP
jgi:PadR family transcriptional regulator